MARISDRENRISRFSHTWSKASLSFRKLLTLSQTGRSYRFLLEDGKDLIRGLPKLLDKEAVDFPGGARERLVVEVGQLGDVLGRKQVVHSCEPLAQLHEETTILKTSLTEELCAATMYLDDVGRSFES
jgi:hypothetical protein